MLNHLADLEDCPTSELRKELARRDEWHERSVCPYCADPYVTHTCRFKGREADYHAPASPDT